MKKFLCLILVYCAMMPTFAKCNCNNNHHTSGCPHHHTTSSSSNSANYLVNTEYKQQKHEFQDCKSHYAITDIKTDYYSNGQRNVYKISTIYNSDGTILISNCQDFEHFIYDKNHYFIIKKQGKYGIYDTSAKVISKKQYSKLQLLKENRILAKLDKKSGIIDLKENTIVPIKYQKIFPTGSDIFITKLNRYFGLLNINNKIILKNDCEKIKKIENYLIVKRYGKFGLYDIQAEKILDIKYDKIKVSNGYILTKLNGLYGAVNIEDNSIINANFNKIKLIRNQLYGFKDKEKVLLFEI